MTRRSSRQGPIVDDYGALVEDINELFARLAKLETPSGNELGSTLAKTNANITELLTRRTFNAEDLGADVTVTALPYVASNLSPITFELTERRRVRVQASCYMHLFAYSNGAGPFLDPWAEGRIALKLSEATLGAISGGSSHTVSAGAGYNSGIRAIARNTGREFIEDYWSLDPGVYTASLEIAAVRLDGDSPTQFRFSFPKSSVEIMEKVA